MERHFRKAHLKMPEDEVSQRRYDKCDRMFSTSWNFRAHVLAVHGDENFKKFLSCTDCGKRFARKKRLESHIKKHHLQIKVKCAV